jgi:hypothetical protein
MKIKTLIIGWGEGATVYRASNEITIEDISVTQIQTIFNVYKNGKKVARIIGMPVEIEYEVKDE